MKEKDLGIYVTRDLKSQEQCTQSATKAQAVLGMVKRHFKDNRLDKYWENQDGRFNFN